MRLMQQVRIMCYKTFSRLLSMKHSINMSYYHGYLCSCFELHVLPVFSQFTHASCGNRRENNNLQWLPRELSNGFCRLNQPHSPGWPVPAWELGLLYNLREVMTQFSVDVPPHQRHSNAVIHSRDQPAAQKEIMSDRKGVPA